MRDALPWIEAIRLPDALNLDRHLKSAFSGGSHRIEESGLPSDRIAIK
jgi:hypothetical protein